MRFNDHLSSGVCSMANGSMCVCVCACVRVCTSRAAIVCMANGGMCVCECVCVCVPGELLVYAWQTEVCVCVCVCVCVYLESCYCTVTREAHTNQRVYLLRPTHTWCGVCQSRDFIVYLITQQVFSYARHTLSVLQDAYRRHRRHPCSQTRALVA